MVCEREIRGEGRWRAGPGKMLGKGGGSVLGSATPTAWKTHFGVDRWCRSQSLASTTGYCLAALAGCGDGRALWVVARRCGVGGLTARRRRARGLGLESQSYGDDGCGYVVGSCTQRRRGWKAAETQRLESRCHYSARSCSICLRTSGGSAARERGDFFRRGVEFGRPRWCLDAAQRAMARASATSGGLGVDSRRK